MAKRVWNAVVIFGLLLLVFAGTVVVRSKPPVAHLSISDLPPGLEDNGGVLVIKGK